MQTTPCTIILANGDFPKSPALLTMLQDAERIICCDGAADELIRFGRKPDAVIGDFDSISDAARQTDNLIHVSEQETNDLTKAFRYCLSSNWRNIRILGATGKREDHTIGNIALLADFAKELPNIRMHSDFGCFFAMTKSGSFETAPNQPISIFAFDNGISISSTGLQWELNAFKPTKLWSATLNRATGNQVSLAFPEGKCVIIYKAN